MLEYPTHLENKRNTQHYAFINTIIASLLTCIRILRFVYNHALFWEGFTMLQACTCDACSLYYLLTYLLIYLVTIHSIYFEQKLHR